MEEWLLQLQQPKQVQAVLHHNINSKVLGVVQISN